MMKKMGLNEIRKAFQDFYVSKEHYKQKSFSLVPEKDKSLLIINSGMAPLKPYFAGLEKPPAKRMTTCQKCIRTGDIENVGVTTRHGTFFEMLGSFSFGDYFKKESLTWGWEFVTKVLNLPEDKIWVTIFEDDDQAFDIWKNVIGIPEARIVRLGKEDNFWEIGTGPCGPCSELYFDRGEEYSCGHSSCKPGCDCDRYVEFWNHVFTQFNKDENGNYTPLAHPNIDTGMGLERLACIMQGVDSIFDVDTIKFILDGVEEISGVAYGNGKKSTDVSIRLITDHIRSVTFMIGDGIIPSNEGRGYVLRRLLRRAARHGKLLNIKGTFLIDLAKKVIETSKGAYPELEEKRDYILKIIETEEDKFSKTIDQGTEILFKYIDEMKSNNKTVLSGEKVFKLYDTFGFPLELTEEILKESNCSADVESFNEYMLQQKETARTARKNMDTVGWVEDDIKIQIKRQNEFVGYETLEEEATVLHLIVDNEEVDRVATGQTATLLVDKTPFYAESGGQIFDTGVLEVVDSKDGVLAHVLEVKKFKNTFAHTIKVLRGELFVNDKIVLDVNREKRNSIARNHTATHLMHKALKIVLGDHVNQAGSSVTDKGLRFDFNHFEAVTYNELKKIENIVNQEIISFKDVGTKNMTIEDAKKEGATALFGEKYGDEVRVVSIGDFSKELCGGTHVANTGYIGSFKILSESGVSSGIRRIEATTGLNIKENLDECEILLDNISDVLKSNRDTLTTKAENILDENKTLKKELENLRKESLGNSLTDITKDAEEINGVKLITKSFEGLEANDLRDISDQVKKDLSTYVLVLANVKNDKVNFLVSVSEDLLDKDYHAGKMIKEIAKAADGGGGGKADMAQAGAKNPAKVPEAFKVAEELIQNM